MLDQSQKILGKAASRAAAQLGFSPVQYFEVLGLNLVSPEDLSIVDAGVPVDPKSFAGKRALQIIRIHRRLLPFIGGHSDALNHWLVTENRQLGARPVDLITTTQGLNKIEAYLESLAR